MQQSPSTSVKRFSTSGTSGAPRSTPTPSTPTTPTLSSSEDLSSTSTRVFSERGQDFEFKRKAFDRWDQLFAMEGTAIAPPEKFFAVSRYAEIWSEVALRPISLEPLNDLERQAVSSGVFHHLARRTPHGSAGAAGGHNHHQQHPSGGQRGGRGGYQPKRAFPSRTHGMSGSRSGQEEEEDTPVLWAEESLTPVSSGGSIDDKGVFHTEQNQNQPPLSVSPPGFQKAEEETIWFYKDPKGNEQGPFTSQVMLDWYQRKFFTDALPLRRQQDVMFEPLGYWRVKNSGKAPFESSSSSTSSAAAPVEAKAEAPRVPEVVSFGKFGMAPLAAAMGEETVVIKDSPSITPIGRPISPKPASPPASPIPAPIAAPVRSTPPSAAPITNTNNGVLKSESAASTKKVDVNALFSSTGSIGRASSKSVSSESLEVSAANPWDTPKATPAVSKVAPVAQPEMTWGKVESVNNAPMLKSIIEEQQKQPIAKPAVAAVPVATSVGWKKVGEAPTTPPLSAIIQEQTKTVKQAEATAAPTKKSGPLSFADLVKSMGSTTIVPPPAQPVAAAPPKIVQRPVATSTAATPVATSVNKPAPVGVIQKPAAVNAILKEWCLSELSPLKSSLDVPTAVSLLMEIKTASEAAAFIRDNLDAGKIDLSAFGREFVKRKFNKELPAYSFIPQVSEEFEEQPFEQVNRRRK